MGLLHQRINKAGRLTGWLAKITAYGLFLPISLVTSCTDRSDEAAQFFLRGNVQLQKREYREAVRFYTEALEKKPDFADAYNNRGLARFRNDDVEGALADYTRAIDTDPDFGAAYLNRAEARLDLGDAGGSLTDLQRIEKQYADSTFYQLRLGDTHTRLNEPARAQLAYDRAIQLDPNNSEALTNRAALFFSQKAYELARQDIAKALQLNPKQDAALNNQSLLLAQVGKFADALTYVDRALSVKPAQPYYLNNKAYLLLMVNRPAEALPLVAQSIRLNDRNAWAYRTLGLYYLKQKQTEPALINLRKAEQLDPSVDALYYYIGRAEAEAGRQEAACAAWARGVTAGDQLAKAEQQKQCGT